MRRTIGARLGIMGLAAACLAGCVGDNPGPTMGSLAADPLPKVATPAATPVSMGPLLEGPMGAKLTEADRQSAFVAETQALASGQRTTWRGSKGVYGFVVPAATGGGCRNFTHTMYFAGRPQTGNGTGCQDPDGGWRISG